MMSDLGLVKTPQFSANPLTWTNNEADKPNRIDEPPGRRPVNDTGAEKVRLHEQCRSMRDLAA